MFFEGHHKSFEEREKKDQKIHELKEQVATQLPKRAQK
jgi:hypothetical protein